jgi:hypothetical protein
MQVALEGRRAIRRRSVSFARQIDKDVDFKPERPDEVFGLAEKNAT